MNGRFVVSRLLQVIPTIAGIVLVGFLLIHIAPGDPILTLAGEHGDAEYYAFMRHHFGLDQPLVTQLGTYFVRVAHGDFSFSYVYGRTTFDVIAERAPATLLLTGAALVLALVVAVPLGAFAARRPLGTRDFAINTVTLGLYSAPVFWIGQIMVLLFALRWGLAPAQGMSEAGSNAGGVSATMDVMRHLALPAIALALQEIAVLARLTRSRLVDELARDHIRTARAKGLSERAVLWRHALPRVLMPVVTVVGARAGHLIAGAVIVEIVFGWPGMGRLLLASLQSRDTPVLLGLFFLVSFTVVLMNLVTDIVHASLDPRISLR